VARRSPAIRVIGAGGEAIEKIHDCAGAKSEQV
jgi:hypothetical protein